MQNSITMHGILPPDPICTVTQAVDYQRAIAVGEEFMFCLKHVKETEIS